MTTRASESLVSGPLAVPAEVSRGGIKMPELPTVSPYLGWPVPFPPGPYGV